MKMPFGKHRGEEVEDLPSDYLTWCLENIKGNEQLIAEMQSQLDAREGRGIDRGRAKP
jgi:uncharacterized protein (DUF3820 family)